jgi:hypothetical protein
LVRCFGSFRQRTWIPILARHFFAQRVEKRRGGRSNHRDVAEWAAREYRERRLPIEGAVGDLITPSWRRSDRVQDVIADAVEEQAQQIDLDEFEDHVEKQGWGAWRPVSGENAEEAVIDLVLSSFEGELRRAAQEIDIDAGELRDALNRVADTLESHGLEV